MHEAPRPTVSWTALVRPTGSDASPGRPRGGLSRTLLTVRPERWTDLPAWLAGPAYAVLADLQGAQAIPNITLYATPAEELDGVVLGLFEGRQGGGRLVSRSLESVELLCEIADILQDELAQTAGGWAQSRPPCPHHSHPARPGGHAGEAWWCPLLDEPLYRLGVGELTPSEDTTLPGCSCRLMRHPTVRESSVGVRKLSRRKLRGPTTFRMGNLPGRQQQLLKLTP